MYSLTRSSTDSQLARMQSGMRKAVRTTNSMEMPSTPILYLMGPSHARSSTNWKSGLAGSKLIQMISESANVKSVVQSAIQRAFCLASELRKHMKIATVAGRKVTTDRRLLPARFIARLPGRA